MRQEVRSTKTVKIGKTEFDLDAIATMTKENFLATHKKVPDAAKVWDKLQTELKKAAKGGDTGKPGKENTGA
jgi:hypothetical protein